MNKRNVRRKKKENSPRLCISKFEGESVVFKKTEQKQLSFYSGLLYWIKYDLTLLRTYLYRSFRTQVRILYQYSTSTCNPF